MTVPNELRAFQLSLGKYLRSPSTEALPFGIDARRARVYEELLFNNISGFINTCFPVSKSLTTSEIWTTITRAFFKDWRARSPFFKDIPEEFLQYLQQSSVLDDLPTWFFELAHYEWVELYIDTADTQPIVPQEDKITLNQPLLPLIYQWPVHRIGAAFQPKSPQETCLIVYRDVDNETRFIETNSATILLLQMLEAKPLSQATLYENLATAFNRPCDEQFKGFCQSIVKDLSQQHVLL